MNLSSYLQMPPAPTVPKSPSTSATQGLAAGVRADTGSTAGLDFANIMARQFHRLSSSERPSFAAEAPPRPEVSAQAPQTHRAQWTNNQSYATKQRLKDDAHTDRADATSKNDAEKNEAEKSTQEKRAEQRAQQLRDAANAHALNAADATLMAQVAMMAMPPTAPTAGSTPTPADASLSLRSIALSPQVNIITSPSATPDAESLTAFAKSMGLDEAAIQKLLGEGSPSPSALAGQMTSTPNPALAPLNGNAVSAGTDHPLMQALNSAASGMSNSSPDASVGLTNAVVSTPQASSAASLTAFAKSMGLDEAAIQKLLGEGSPSPSALAGQMTSTPNPALAPLNGNAVSAGTDHPLMQALNSAASGMSNSSPDASVGLTNAVVSTPQASSAATQLSALGLLPGSGAGEMESLTATTPPAVALVTQLPAAVNTPGMAPQAPIQAGLSAAEMASLQSIQITISAPVATPVASMQNMVMGANGSLKTSTSTLDALSLLGGNVTEQSISDLVAQFSNNASGDDAQQQPSSDNSSGQGFAQALAQTTAPGQGTRANAASPVTTTTPMSEVYDQLSDKMATEMAARMHKQLSDGEWKMKFGLRPAHLGGVEIQLEMKDGKLNAVIHAENPLTRDLLQNSSQRLRDALENFGIHAGQMHIGQDSGNAQQNPSRGSSKPSQVGDNSPLQVKGSDNVASATETRNKANASLLDLYA